MTILLFASLLLSGNHGSAISYFEPAAPLARLIPALSASLNLPLEVSPNLASDVVCVDVHNVTSKDLLDRLAWATVGEWEQTKSGAYKLVPSAAGRTSQAAEELRRRAGQIQKYLNPPKRAEDDLKPAPTNDEGELDARPLLRLVDPTVLASIPEGSRAVFSTRPNKLQYLFSADITQEVSAMIAKRNESAQRLGQANNSHLRVQPIVGTVDKVLLAVTPIYFGDDEAVEGEVILYDKNGKDITGSHGSEAGSDSSNDESDDSKPVALSHESKLFAQFVATETDGMGMLEMLRFRTPEKQARISEDHRAEALERFLSPDRYDPLAYVSDLLRSLAHVNSEQVVACLPDSFACNIGLVFDGELREKSLQAELTQNKDMDIRSSDGWLTGRPRDPALAEAERVDRKQLAQTLAMLQTRDYIRLADQEAVAKLGFDLHPDSLVNLWCTLARPTYFSTDRDDNWDMVRLFATLSDQQQQVLEAEHNLPLNVLNPEQTSILSRLVYGPNGSQFLHLDAEAQNSASYLEPEMTELLPNGLPSVVNLTMAVTSHRAVQALDRAGPKFRHVLGFEATTDEALIQGAAKLDTIKSHARELASDDTDSFTQDIFSASIPTALRLGSLRQLEFGVQILKDLKGTTTLEDDDMSGNETISYSALKSQLKSVYDEAVQVQESINSVLGGAGVGGGGGGTPPPPN